MATRRVNGPQDGKPRRPPATTPLAREQELVALAVDLAEQQIRNGTASAQVLTHYLKLGSSREHLEQERLKEDIEVARKRRDIMDSQIRMEELYTKAMEAFAGYQGAPIPDPQGEDDYYDR